MHTVDEYASPRAPLLVKYGGNALSWATGADPVLEEIAARFKAGERIVLVHGGGPEIDALLALRNVSTHRIDGLRVTDEQTLEVTEAVLCGTINKRLVRQLGALGALAVGISGEDGATLTARRASNAALGFVGETIACNPTLILTLLEAGFLPVVAPLGVASDATSALNINGDSAAAAIAGAIGARAFILLTNISRVLADIQDPSSAIDRLTLASAQAFAKSPACAGGMLPKMTAAVDAVLAGTQASYIAAARPSAIALALSGDATVIGESMEPLQELRPLLKKPAGTGYRNVR